MGKADLHVHTFHSPDALASIPAILKRAKERQLDVVAITDHDTVKGAKEAQKIAEQFNIEIVVGQETTTKEGDLIALFIQERIKPERSAAETIKEIHQQGGLAVVPHPNDWFVGGIPFPELFKIFGELDGLELLNGGWFGWLGQKESRELNKSKFHLAVTGGSDSHLAREVGCAYTEFEGKTASDLYASIKAKSTWYGGTYWSYEDRFLWLFSFPMIFYKWPMLPVLAARNVFKKVFTPHLLKNTENAKRDY